MQAWSLKTVDHWKVQTFFEPSQGEKQVGPGIILGIAAAEGSKRLTDGKRMMRGLYDMPEEDGNYANSVYDRFSESGPLPESAQGVFEFPADILPVYSADPSVPAVAFTQYEFNIMKQVDNEVGSRTLRWR